jgi:serine phosphatase RsbU (regulator of sigma subunit)
VPPQVTGGQDVLIGPRSTRPDRRLDLYLTLGATFLAVGVFLAAMLVEALPSRGLAVPFLSAAPISAGFALVILGVRARTVPDARLAWFTVGLGVGVVAMVLQLISFPLVAPGGGILETSQQANASLYLLFHVSIAAGAVLGALGTPPEARIPSFAAGSVVAVLVALDIVPVPELIRADASFTPLRTSIEVLVLLFATAAVLLWVRQTGRAAAALHGWVGVALSLSVYDLLLNLLAQQRFTALWWGSLSLRGAAFVVLAVGSLGAVLSQLRDAEAYGESELDRREGQLRSSLSETAELLSSAEELSRAVTSTQVADVLSAKARALARATYASVVVGRRGQALHLLGADGYTPDMREELEKVEWDPLLPGPYVHAVGRPLFLQNGIQIRGRFPRIGQLPMRDAEALAALPIKVRDEAIAVLSVWAASPRQWSQNERRVLAGLAAQGGQAIARAQAYEEQAAAARTLQASLLPARLPRPARLELATRYVPAQDGVLVGGDWYDCLVLEDGRVALVVGDVMGKGLHAAAQMGQIRMAVRSVAALDPAPAAVLSALDDLNMELGDDEIVTLVYVLVDPRRGVARVARAGHLPPLLVHPEGRVCAIDGGGSPPLGAPFGERAEEEFGLPEGGLLVLYTDGLVEDRASGLDRGMPQLAAALADLAPSGQSTGDIAARLLEVCSLGRGQDDIALLLARYA